MRWIQGEAYKAVARRGNTGSLGEGKSVVLGVRGFWNDFFLHRRREKMGRSVRMRKRGDWMPCLELSSMVSPTKATWKVDASSDGAVLAPCCQLPLELSCGMQDCQIQTYPQGGEGIR